jgi:transposase-like protein
MVCRCPTPFREAACERMLAGERPEELADELELSAPTLYRWKKQTLVTRRASRATNSTNRPGPVDVSGISKPNSNWSRRRAYCPTARS